MLKIGTWMAGSRRISAPFTTSHSGGRWAFRARLSASAGRSARFHDGSNHLDGPYGLTGFVGVPAVQRSQNELVTEAIIAQLAVIFGAPAAQPTAFFYQDWARERFTATSLISRRCNAHPHYHPPAGKTSIWEGTLLFAGTETATEHGGYLEGALGRSRTGGN